MSLTPIIASIMISQLTPARVYINDVTAIPVGFKDMILRNLRASGIQVDGEVLAENISSASAVVENASLQTVVVNEISTIEGGFLASWHRWDEVASAPKRVESGSTSLTIPLCRSDKELYCVYLKIGDIVWTWDRGEVAGDHARGFTTEYGDYGMGTHASITLEVRPAWNKQYAINCFYMLKEYTGPDEDAFWFAPSGHPKFREIPDDVVNTPVLFPVRRLRRH